MAWPSIGRLGTPPYSGKTMERPGFQCENSSAERCQVLGVRCQHDSSHREILKPDITPLVPMHFHTYRTLNPKHSNESKGN